jgi:23S rRNA (uracil1939-C5)-methyltransferase
MTKKPLPIVEVTLNAIVGGGQTIATMDDGRKLFVWGGLPGEKVKVQVTKKKSKLAEGVVVEVLEPSEQRTEPKDPDSYLSTSPWQIMEFDAEQHYKSALIEEAFELHDIVLPGSIEVYSNSQQYGYRNKIEFSWWWDTDTETLDLAFFRRGTHGKIPIQDTSLAHESINQTASAVRDMLRARKAEARQLKTLLVRCDSRGKTTFQLYVKDKQFEPLTQDEAAMLPHENVGFEVIYANPLSPASVITKRLQALGQVSLTDTIMDVPFNYATEGFFQINLPVYEQALRDMKEWIVADKPVVDLYSGVGTIGLTIGGNNVTLVELNEHAVREMKRNIHELGRVDSAKAVLAASENALEYITGDAAIIVDPPRAGLHEAVVDELLESAPERIIYLSCNPVTQARDVARLAEKYGIRHHMGYNFFPRTPHIEHLVILDKKAL